MARVWSPVERDLLKQYYPQVGGVRLCLEAMPYRTRSSIHEKAKSLNLKTKNDYARRRKYNFTEAQDQIIREEYAKDSRSAVIKVLALRLSLEKQTVARRAAELGLTLSRTKPDDWSEAELRILEKYAHRSPLSIQKMLKQSGFKRTISAIANARTRNKFSCSISDDEWTPYFLATMFGVSPGTIYRWIEKEGLEYVVMPSRRAESTGESKLIKRKVLRNWVATHAQCVDLRKVDRYWFIDLLVGPE